MLNVLTQSHIAGNAVGHEEPDVVLGATLRDFRAKYLAGSGQAVQFYGHNPMLSAGVDLSRRVDMAAVESPLFGEMVKPLAEDITSLGVHEKASAIAAESIMGQLIDRALTNEFWTVHAFAELGRLVCAGETVLEETYVPGRTETFLPEEFVRSIKKYFRFGHLRTLQEPKNITWQTHSYMNAASKKEEERLGDNDTARKVAEVTAGHAERIGELGLILVDRIIKTKRWNVSWPEDEEVQLH